jgi:hypothetical protein
VASRERTMNRSPRMPDFALAAPTPAARLNGIAA